MAKGKRVSVLLGDDLWEWTKASAAKRKRSRSNFIMQIVRNARKREEEEHKKKPSWLARFWRFLGSLVGCSVRLHHKYQVVVHHPEGPPPNKCLRSKGEPKT